MSEFETQPGEMPQDPSEERDTPSRPAWQSAHRVLLVVMAAALVIWISSGFYSVGAGEVAVVERLGKYLATPEGRILQVDPGVHFGLPWPLDRVEKIGIQATHKMTVDTFNVAPAAYQKAKQEQLRANVAPEVVDSQYNPYLITADMNVVHMAVVVTYNVSDVDAYIKAVAEMAGHDAGAREETLHRVIEHELVTTVAKADIGTILYDGREKVRSRLLERIREAMRTPAEKDASGQALPRKLRFGIEVQAVDLPNVRVPDRVKPDFEKAYQASSDQKAMEDQAQGEYSSMVLQAEAQAAAIVAEATAYKQRMTQTAQGEADRFKSIWEQYKKDPDVTRYDMWQATMREVLSKANRIYYVEPDQVLHLTLPPPERMAAPGAPQPGGPPR